jgi:hypothetical protein
MARISKLSELPKNKNTYDVKNERERGFLECRSYSPPHRRVSIEWGLNKDANDMGICKIKVGDAEAFVKAEDLRRALRWV